MPDDVDSLEQLWSLESILKISDGQLDTFNAKAYSNALAQAAEAEGAKVIIVSSSADTKFLAPILTTKLNGGYVPNVVAAPQSTPHHLLLKGLLSAIRDLPIPKSAQMSKLLVYPIMPYGILENNVSASVENFLPCQFG